MLSFLFLNVLFFVLLASFSIAFTKPVRERIVGRRREGRRERERREMGTESSYIFKKER